MKTYHSIPDTYADYYGRRGVGFYKYDGSNLRFLWTAKQGWCRFGTRNQLFDKTTHLFSQAIEVFNEKYKDRLTWIIKNDRDFTGVRECMAFMEFFGPRSFAGRHKFSDPKELVLFDFNVGKKGLLGPDEFRQKFRGVETAQVVHEGVLDEEFANLVRRRGLPTDRQPLFEGVIYKGGTGHKLWMVKIKSRHYIDQLQAREQELATWNEHD